MDLPAVGPRARRLAAALGLGLLASLANPRGAAQHLAFWTASREAAIFAVVDEWAPFDPFGLTNVSPAVSPLSWLLADLLLATFAGVAAAGVLLFLHRPTARRLRAVDPLLLGLGAAGCAALLVAIRFFWMAVFPLLFLLRVRRVALAETRGLDNTFGLAALALAVALPLRGDLVALTSQLPRDASDWWGQAHLGGRFFEGGVRFLEETGVEGNLYHAHFMGGLLCYRLAPGLRTFVDGSMNLPDGVALDYRNLKMQRGSWPYESFTQLLDRRGVDLFFGIGVPTGSPRASESGLYTTANLERADGWMRVARSMRWAIYLRRNERNRENLARIAEWYRRQGVPFDPARGLDIDAVIRERPDWAIRQRLLPANHAELLAAARGGAPRERVAALESLGLAYALSGAYAHQLENDREAIRLRPDAKAPRRRLVYGLLREGRAEEAAAAAERLLALDPDDERSRRFAAVAESSRRRARRGPPPADAIAPLPLDAAINTLPLVTSRQPLRQ